MSPLYAIVRVMRTNNTRHLWIGNKRKATPEYKAWQHMKSRCLNPMDANYHHYGGRGIKICNRWLKFDNFYEDMGKKPDNLTLDRTNNEGNYEFENCRWATRSQQMINRRVYKNNTSGFIGVYWFKPQERWVASIQLEGKRILLGYFKLKEMAAVAYDCAAIQLHGEKARLNIL
jgi:hypothetical protein